MSLKGAGEPGAWANARGILEPRYQMKRMGEQHQLVSHALYHWNFEDLDSALLFTALANFKC